MMALLLASGGSGQAQPAAADGASAEVHEKVDPQVVVQDVRLALRGSNEVPSGAVTAVVHAGTIVLTGEVASEAQAARAVSVAEQKSRGVRVASHLTIAASRPVPTQAPQLVRDVEAALRADPRTSNLGVVVSIDAGEVIGLHGLVPSRDSRAVAEQVAAGVRGVQRVSSRLVVAGE
jgi:osmotically-inducible protein OsmY